MHTKPRNLPTILTESARARGAAVSLLARLFQSMLTRQTLVVQRASPPAFKTDDFAELLALVVDALPSRLAHRCRILFPMKGQETPPQPEEANLIVLDAGRTAAPPGDRQIQLDEDGESLDGDAPDDPLLDYAEAVIAGALAQPNALDAFSARFDRLLSGASGPDADTLELTATVYTVSTLFASPTVGSAGMLRRHLTPLASSPDLPWPVLIGEHEWAMLNAADLSAWVLVPPPQLSAGEQALQRAMVNGLERAGWQLDDPPPPWRRPADTDWWERLRHLLNIAPGLLPASLLSELARGTSLDKVPAAAWVPLLTAELAQRSLWRRRWQARELASACTEPGVSSILLDAVEQGELDSTWLEHLAADTKLLGRLPAAQLLRLAAFDGISVDDKERVCCALDRCMAAEDPSDGVGALIKAGAWSVWRRSAVLCEQRRKQLALAWMTHPNHRASGSDLPASWEGLDRAASPPSSECTIDTWRCVVEDLVGGLSAAEIRRIFGSGRRWPLIYPYAQRQIDDLAACCMDLDALAEFVDRIGNDQGEPDLERLLTTVRFAHPVSANAFAWLLTDEGLRRTTPPSLDETTWLCAHIVERTLEAEDARVAAVTAELFRDPPRALQAACEPLLWGRSDFRQPALQVLVEQLTAITGGPEWVNTLDRTLDWFHLPANGPGAMATDLDQARRRLVCDLVGYGLERLAYLLAGGIDFLHHCQVLHKIVLALLHDDACDGAWVDLIDLCVKAPHDTAGHSSHPMIHLAAILSSGAPGGAIEVKDPAFETLERALVKNPFLLTPARGTQGARLPLLHLIAVLSGSEAGDILPALITGSACHIWAHQPEWRQAVLATLQDPGDGPLAEVAVRDREAVVRVLEEHWSGSGFG